MAERARPILDDVGHPEVIVANGAPSHHRRLPRGCGHALRTALTVLWVFSSPRCFRARDICSLSLPDFLWAHRSGNSSPLRPTRLLLSRLLTREHGSLQ